MVSIIIPSEVKKELMDNPNYSLLIAELQSDEFLIQLTDVNIRPEVATIPAGHGEIIRRIRCSNRKDTKNIIDLLMRSAEPVPVVDAMRRPWNTDGNTIVVNSAYPLGDDSD